MASILKVDTIQDQSGNNIINESADTITIGASGDTCYYTASGFGTNTPAFNAYISAVSGTSMTANTGATLTMYTALSNITCFFYINGGATAVNKPKGVGIYNTAGSATTITYVADLAEGDTVGLYGFSVATNAAQGTSGGNNDTFFCGFKLI
jgi:hypothetical protein